MNDPMASSIAPEKTASNAAKKTIKCEEVGSKVLLPLLWEN